VLVISDAASSLLSVPRWSDPFRFTEDCVTRRTVTNSPRCSFSSTDCGPFTLPGPCRNSAPLSTRDHPLFSPQEPQDPPRILLVIHVFPLAARRLTFLGRPRGCRPVPSCEAVSLGSPGLQILILYPPAYPSALVCCLVFCSPTSRVGCFAPKTLRRPTAVFGPCSLGSRRT